MLQVVDQATAAMSAQEQAKRMEKKPGMVAGPEALDALKARLAARELVA
jgi:hypothetical protein